MVYVRCYCVLSACDTSQIMNTTTLTIESVHGLKQTFVLGPSKPADKPTSNDESHQRRQPVEDQATSTSARSPR